MQSTQKEKMSREEIIHYVDDLINANKKSYDKRLAPLLYEFFLRTNEKFEWSRKEFLEKYQSFRYNVKKIKFEKMKGLGGFFKFSHSKKGIFLNKENLKNIKENPANYIIYENIINPFFHECLHATDLLIDDNEIINNGLFEIMEGHRLYEGDTMLNEYANVLSTTIISSNNPMYYDNLGIETTNNLGYEKLIWPGSIICAAFDMSEIELAKLKDKGRDFLNLYLKNKFPYMDTEVRLNIYKAGLNVIYATTDNNNNNNKNVKFGLENIIDTALIGIEERISGTFEYNENIEESLERIYYSIYKIQKLLEKVDSEYEIEDDKEIYNMERFKTIDELLNKVRLYKRFLNNKDLFTITEQEKIHKNIVEYGKKCNVENVAKELIESKIGQKYSDDEFNIEEIAKKYYLPSNGPLNDNRALIEQVKRSFIKPTIKEKLKKIIGIEQEEFPILPPVTEQLKTIETSNIRNSIKYETPIIHNTSTEKQEQQDISKGDEESTR